MIQFLQWQSALQWVHENTELTINQLDAIIVAMQEKIGFDQKELDSLHVGEREKRKIKYQQQHEEYLDKKIGTWTEKWAYEDMLDAQLKLDALKTRKKYVDSVVKWFNTSKYQPLVLKSKSVAQKLESSTDQKKEEQKEEKKE